jgi:hypothetical protein
MKKLNIFLASAMAVLSLASCDINDVQNVGELSTSTFPVSKEDGEAVLAGVYQNLNQVCADPQMSFLYYAQLASDDMLGGAECELSNRKSFAVGARCGWILRWSL